MDPDERVQRPAMVAGRQVRGTSNRERRRGQDFLDRQAIAQLAKRGFEDPAGVGLLDELQQPLDVIAKPYGPMHGLSPLVLLESACRLNPTAEPDPAQQSCGNALFAIANPTLPRRADGALTHCPR